MIFKGVFMKNSCVMYFAAIFAMLFFSFSAMGADTVAFEPVRAPSMGPEDAPVTIIEIADYM